MAHPDQWDAGHLDDPSIWTERLPSGCSSAGPFLAALDAELRCQICQELYRAPVSLQPCQHTFCSECIRRALADQYNSMNRKTRCVSCNEPVDHRNDKCLVPNRALEKAVLAFTKLRGPLLQVLLLTTTTSRSVSTGNDVGEVSSYGTTTTETGRRRSRRLPSTSSSAAADSIDDETEMGRHDQENNNNTATSTTASSSSKDAPTANNNNIIILRPKKAKPFYNNKTKKQLRELCHTAGLPDHGSDDELRHRHQNYITLYNSECDSVQPLSVRDIVATIVRREKERHRQQYAPTYKDIEASRPLTQQMNEGFRQLIANARKKNQQTSHHTNQTKQDDDETDAAMANEEDDDTPLGKDQAKTDKEIAGEKEHDDSSYSPTEEIPKQTYLATKATKVEPVLPSLTNEIFLSRRSDEMSLSQAMIASPPPSNDDTRSSFFTIPRKKRTSVESKMPSLLPPRMPKVGETPSGSTVFAASSKHELAQQQQLGYKKQRCDDSSLLSPGTPTGTSSTSSPLSIDCVVVATQQKQRQQRNSTFFADFKPRKRQSSPNHHTSSSSRNGSTSGGRPPPRPSIIGPWTCSVCTFDNQIKIMSRDKCEMCQTVRTTAATTTSASAAAASKVVSLVLSP
jgi:E3 ubiquitin-protein ligase RAD18